MTDDDELARELGLEPAPIEAEVVRDPVDPRARNVAKGREVAARNRKERAMTPVAMYRDKKFVYAMLSERERKAIDIYLKTGSRVRAAEEIGVEPQTITNYFKRPFVRAYLEIMRERSAKAADLTIDKAAAVISRALDGDEGVSDRQLLAAEKATKLLRPTAANGSPITINQQNNFNGPSPFQGLDSAAMLAELRRNLIEMGVEDDPGRLI